jgi:O-antigen/teichoic acid export membrane protein
MILTIWRYEIKAWFGRHSSSGLSGNGIYWTAAAALMVIPGVVRTKGAAVYFGLEGIGVFGQVTQLQTLLVTVGAAGLGTAARVFLSRVRSPDNSRPMASWFLYWPVILAVIIALPIILLSGPIAEVLTGSSGYWFVVASAGLGLPVAVAAQQAIAVLQTLGSPLSLLVSALAAAGLGAGATFLLMSSQSLKLAACSLFVAPVIQVLMLVAFSRCLRLALITRPQGDSEIRREVLKLGLSSFVLGACAALADLLVRAFVVQRFGVAEIASYQPVALIVVQMLGLMLSSFSTSTMVQIRGEVARATEAVHRLLWRFVLVYLTLSSIMILFAPWLISFFFSEQLVSSATPILALALAGDSVRAASWVVGATLLPLGARRPWMTAGILTVLTQALVAWALIPHLGAFGLVIGLVCGNIFNLVSQVYIARGLGVQIGHEVAPSIVVLCSLVYCAHLISVSVGSVLLPLPAIIGGIIGGVGLAVLSRLRRAK